MNEWQPITTSSHQQILPVPNSFVCKQWKSTHLFNSYMGLLVQLPPWWRINSTSFRKEWPALKHHTTKLICYFCGGEVDLMAGGIRNAVCCSLDEVFITPSSLLCYQHFTVTLHQTASHLSRLQRREKSLPADNVCYLSSCYQSRLY